MSVTELSRSFGSRHDDATIAWDNGARGRWAVMKMHVGLLSYNVAHVAKAMPPSMWMSNIFGHNEAYGKNYAHDDAEMEIRLRHIIHRETLAR
jgi:hypothetical protein